MLQSIKMADRRNFRNVVGSTKYYLTFVAALLALFGVWYFVAHAVNKPFTFPFVENVLKELAYALVDTYVWRNIAITFSRVYNGILYAILIGFPLGILMGYSGFAKRLLAPFINAVRQIPITSWIPLAIIWFGLGSGPSIFVITLTAIFTVVLNTIAGVSDIEPEFYHAVRSMGAGTLGVVKDVVLPGCVSGLITGTRIALGSAWMTVV
jgi:NitT/TauT family transport system permease protein